MFFFLAILVVFMIGWGVAQYSMLYPQTKPGFWHAVDAITLAYHQMYGDTYADSVIRAEPFDMPAPDSAEEDCTSREEYYSNYTKIRCSDRRASYPVFIMLSVFLLLTNLLLLNLLIAIFSTTYSKIEGVHTLFVN